MLFGRKNCSQCGSQYDVVEKTCPVCHAPDEDFETRGIPKNVIWLPIYKQLLLFVFGLFLLNIAGVATEYILYYAVKLDPTTVDFSTILNAVRYTFTFIAMGALINVDFVKFGKHFNKAKPYLFGLAGGAALIGASIFLNIITNLFYTTTDNANQELVVAIITKFPIVSVIVIGILGPIVEELTYRLGLFSFFCRIKKWLAYVVVTIVFALIHFDFFAGSASAYINELLNLPSYLAAGFLLCLWYDKFGLASSMTAHIVNNLYSIVATILYQEISKL